MRAISLSFSVILFSTAAFASTPAVLVIDEQVPVQELQALIANIPESYEVISPENLSIHLKNRWTATSECSVDDETKALIHKAYTTGYKCFYEKTDLRCAAKQYQIVLNELEQQPYILHADSNQRLKLVEALLMWLHVSMNYKKLGHPRDLAKRIGRLFGPDEIAKADVPPMAKTLLEEVRSEVQWGYPTVNLTAIGLEADDLLTLVVGDAVVGEFKGTLSFLASPGEHILTVISKRYGSFEKRVTVNQDTDLAIDLNLSKNFKFHETLPALLVEDQKVLQALQHQEDIAVISISELIKDAQSKAVTVDTVRTKLDNQSIGSITTGLCSAGFLAAGIALNVQANQSVQAINTGSNRLDLHKRQKAGSIACYTLGGAAGLTAILLAVIKPAKKAPAAAVLPLEQGAAISATFSF